MTGSLTVALTGATGFVGGATLNLLLARGHRVRALTRRPQPARTGVEWIDGSLDRPDRLLALATGAEAVLHLAGVVSGTPDAFTRGNVDGTRHLLAAAAAAGVPRFVHVSSLAAREPALSVYGRSKDAAETLVRASDRDWSIVRPPGVYGPGDTEMRDVFRMAKLGIVLLPPDGRLSVIHVDDLARLLIVLVEQPGVQETLECDDGTAGGYSHRDFAAMVGAAVGRTPTALPVPAFVLKAAARLDVLVRRDGAKLTPDRAAYLSHVDWTASPASRPPSALWTPSIPTPAGLAATAAWYRTRGLL